MSLYPDSDEMFFSLLCLIAAMILFIVFAILKLWELV